MSELIQHIPAGDAERFRRFFAGRRCMVTGGTGFIGSHIVDALVAFDADVTVLDDLSNSSPHQVSRLIEAHPARVRFVLGSVLDERALASAAEGASVIFHQAAVCSVPRSIKQPARCWSVNATGTVRVLDAAREGDCHRLVFAASSSAYGNRPELPRRENQLPQPLSPYAASKLAGEAAIVAYAESFGLSTVGLRYFNIFGPRQRPGGPYAGVIPAFAERLSQGRPPRVFGDGSQSRDFTCVPNAVYANLLAAASEEPLTGHIINIGTGDATTVRDLAVRMARLWPDPDSDIAPSAAAESSHVGGEPGDSDQGVQLEHELPRPGDVQHSHADISAAEHVLGYRPVVSIDDGLRSTVRWLKEHLRTAGSLAAALD